MQLSTRREIRDYAKQVLQTYGDTGVIESEELRDCLKRVGEAVAPPVTRTTVAEATLQTLLTFLRAQGAADDATARVQEELATLRHAPVQNVAPKTPAASAQTEKSTPTVGGTVAAAKAAFSLGALRARMAKKREELKVTRSTTHVVALTESGGSAAVAQLVTSGESVDGVVSNIRGTAATDANTLRGALSAPQSGAASTASLPRSSGVTNVDEAMSSRLDGTASHTGTIGTKRERPEVLLSACPIIEDDLYADLALPTSRPVGREAEWRSGEAYGMNRTPVSGAPRRAMGYAPDEIEARQYGYDRNIVHQSYYMNTESHMAAYHPY